MSPWEYKNIVTIGLRMKEFSWVQKFIEQYIKYPEPSQQKCVDLQYRKLVFFPEKFPRNFAVFQEVEFTDLYYQLDVRAILLKAYFSLEEEKLFITPRFQIIPEQEQTRVRLSAKDLPEFCRNISCVWWEIWTTLKACFFCWPKIKEVRQIADVRWLEEKLTKDKQAE